MSFTGLQETRTRSREQRRRMAWIDGRALAVGRYDALLFRAQCPYPDGSALATDWHIGYEAVLEERQAESARSEASLTQIVSSLRQKGGRT